MDNSVRIRKEKNMTTLLGIILSLLTVNEIIGLYLVDRLVFQRFEEIDEAYSPEEILRHPERIVKMLISGFALPTAIVAYIIKRVIKDSMG